MFMFRALLPLLLTCGICAAAPPTNAGSAPQTVPVRSPQAEPAPNATPPAKEATPATPATPAKPAKADPAQEGLKSDSYRALLSLIVMGTIALRHARNGSP
jgi:hypothetical protein